MPKVTLEQIAQDLGVSKVAVFKALNNKKGVSDELRQKAVDAAQRLGYITKSAAVEANNKKFLYFINQDFFLTPSEQFYSTIFYFLSAECTKSNSFLQIAFLEANNKVERMKEIINTFMPDGLFVAGQIDDETLEYLNGVNIPTVFIDYFSPFYNFHYVYVDNYNLSYTLTRYLIDKGHRSIGFVGDISSTSSIADRYFGYRKALNEADIEYCEEKHINNNLERNDNLLNVLPSEMPTAFICHCDAAAQKLYTALALKGYKVPDDISIISFDDTPLCENLAPRLTSAGPRKEFFAKKAFNTMIDALTNKNRASNSVVKTFLVERDSVKSI